jgi:hypothetical protein
LKLIDADFFHVLRNFLLPAKTGQITVNRIRVIRKITSVFLALASVSISERVNSKIQLVRFTILQWF